MNLTRTAYGTWNGGRFMNFGESVSEERFIHAIQLAYESGIRTFMTADVYGAGQADELLGKALIGVPRGTFCLVGAIGHDFYTGKREGSKGYPRFTSPALRGPEGYADYIRMATEKSLARCQADHFDLVMLHNPDWTGYSSEAVWKGMAGLQQAGLTEMLGVAPGPANGFTLDLIHCFEKFGSLLDWAMIILNPLEPWPGSLSLAAAEKFQVDLITRVVDYGGLFHDDVKPGHKFPHHDHRTFRPAGWVEAGAAKIDQMRGVAQSHKLTMLQLACLWNLSQNPVRSVIPTLIQEEGGAKTLEDKIRELAALPEVRLSAEEIALLRRIGENKGCMALKGGNPQHSGEIMPDRWPVFPELLDVGKRWQIEPEKDLILAHTAG